MRFIVYGAGAIGGVVGGRLFEHGHEVALVARGAHLAAMRERGLRVDSPDGSVTLDVPATGRPEELGIGAGDVVVVAVKSQDTASVLEALSDCASPDTPIVCLQNGVHNERAALRRFANVHAVAVMCPTTHVEAGIVEANSSPMSGVLDIGRYPHGADAVTEAVAGALNASTFVSQVRPDIMRWKWAKLLMNLANAAEALCGPSARESPIVKLARREGVACMRAAGIDVASQEEDRERRGDILQVRPIGGRVRGGGSSWQSVVRGTGTIESDYLNGEIVLLGRLHGVPTPVNELLQRRARDLARTGAPPGSVSPDELLAELPPSPSAPLL